VNKLAAGLKDRFKLDDEAVTKMMKMAPVAIKTGATLSEAERYKEILETIGAKVQIGPSSEQPQEETQQAEEGPPPVEGGTPQSEEQQAAAEGPASLDREPQVIPVRAKTPPPPAEAAESTGTKTEAQMITCPQCGYVQEQTDECIKCGVIISKFLKYQEEVKPVEFEGTSPGAIPPPPPSPGAEGPLPQRGIGTPIDEPETSTPWEDMARLGFTTALFRTIKEVFSTPDVFFRRMPVNKGILNPLIFGIIAGYVAALIQAFWQYVFRGMLGGGLNFGGVSPVILYAFILPILIIIGLFIGSIIIHISVMMFGGKRGFEATFRVLSFSNSIQVIASIVPVLGALFAFIYFPVVIVVGLKEIHQVTMGRAALAVFVSLIIAALIIGGLFSLLFVTILATFTGSMMPQQPPVPGF
jgi:hypothetical protein